MSLSLFAAANEIRIPECKKTPTMNGTLNDACWKHAAKVTDFYLLRDRAGSKTSDTTVMLTRDNKWLYVGVKCINRNMPHVEQNVSIHDGIVSKDESVEVFISPEANKKLYYMFVLSFANVKHERRMIGGNRDIGWNCPWRSKTKRLPDGWTAEIAIPLYAIEGCGSKKLAFNVIRNKSEIQLDKFGSKNSEKKVYSSLSKLDRSAHEPQNFTPVSGLENLKPEEPFAPVISGASAGSYEKSGDKLFYPVDIVINPATTVSGKVKVCVAETSGGKTREVAENVKVDGCRKLRINVPVMDFKPKKLEVFLRSQNNKSVLDSMKIADTSSLEIMKKIVSDLNYYSKEKTARLKISLGFAKDQLKNMTLKVSDGKKYLLRKTDLSPEMIIEVPVEKLKNGTSKVEVALLKNGKKFISRSVELKRYPLAPNGVKIDNFNRVMLKNGKGFFPFGVFLGRVRSEDEYLFKFLSEEIGMNTVIRVRRYWKNWPWMSDLKDLPNWMKIAQKYNLNVINMASMAPSVKADNALARKEYQAMLPDITGEIELLKDNPNFLMYYNLDEPNLANADTRIKVADWFYHTVRKHDRRNPVNLLYAKHIPEGKYWTDWCEVLMYDVYVCPGWGGFYSDPGLMMSYYMCMLDERAKQDGKVAMMVPISANLTPPRAPISLTYQQQLCQSYAAVIYGAKGLIYFTQMLAITPEHWKAFKVLAGQFKALAPAITNQEVKQKISYSPGKLDPHSRTFPMINVRLFKYPDEKLVMLAANFKPFAVETSFRIPGLESASLMFNGKKILPVSGNTFKDKFIPYGTRAYSLKLKNSSAEIKVAVKMTPCPNEKVSPPAVPVNKIIAQLRSRKKNLMPNPVFERAKVKGLPDFMIPYSNMAPVLCTKDSAWFVDAKNKWNGKASLCMKNLPTPSSRYYPQYLGTNAVFYPLISKKPEKYVFSFYAKGGKNGERITIILQDYFTGFKTQKAFILTTGWKRFNMKFTLPPLKRPELSGGGISILISRPKAGGTAWINGLQMEPGDKMTDFSDDSIVKETVRDKNNLVENDIRKWHGGYRIKVTQIDKQFCFTGKTPGFGIASNFFKVDPNKTYQLSGRFKNTGKNQAPLAFGIIPYDKEQRRIMAYNLCTVKGTETELVEACLPESMNIKVKDASKWRDGKRLCAAFNQKPGIPNFNTTPLGIKKIVKSGDVWNIILLKPCGKSFPAGTKVAENIQNSFICMYPVRPVKTIPEKWTEYRAAIKGFASGPSVNQWWPGTEYGKAVITIGKNAKTVLFDDISVKEINIDPRSKNK